MKRLEIYEPAGCVGGNCNSEIEKELVRMEHIVNDLREKGVSISRFNVMEHSQAFLDNPLVKNALETEGLECLPLVLSEGVIMSREEYPSDLALAKWGGLPWSDLEVYAELEKRDHTFFLTEEQVSSSECSGSCDSCDSDCNE
ncbi:arsenic metallochaperone ArsD family protein [Eubacteriaceae bacterium ES3]|nr:arsenic metallochaperone ArsD family protein [Eubacteriaceae bacterium ES3]